MIKSIWHGKTFLWSHPLYEVRLSLTTLLSQQMKQPHHKYNMLGHDMMAGTYFWVKTTLKLNRINPIHLLHVLTYWPSHLGVSDILVDHNTLQNFRIFYCSSRYLHRKWVSINVFKLSLLQQYRWLDKNFKTLHFSDNLNYELSFASYYPRCCWPVSYIHHHRSIYIQNCFFKMFPHRTDNWLWYILLCCSK